MIKLRIHTKKVYIENNTPNNECSVIDFIQMAYDRQRWNSILEIIIKKIIVNMTFLFLSFSLLVTYINLFLIMDKRIIFSYKREME